jgi:CRP/FNR family cyclic AMP-dependent transcriptional regulator
MLRPVSSGLAAKAPGVTRRRRSPSSRLVGVTRPPCDAICQVLREDPDLAVAIPPADRDRAIDECTAPALRIRRGRWGSEGTDMARDGIGMLVLQGLLIRRVGVDGRFGAELLGDGDLLRPGQGEDGQTALPLTTDWRVLEPTRVAVLDKRATQRLARYPDLIAGLVGRAVERSHELAVRLAIVQHPRVDVRLLMLLWHLADRWGRVGHHGTYLPMRLTHAILAELVAARRPTVTRAFSLLADRGLVRVVDEAWMLSGEPPRELLELGPREATRSISGARVPV